jgi:hypothetical protein
MDIDDDNFEPVGLTDGMFHGPVGVDYGQIELDADQSGELPDWGDFFQHSPVGLIGTQPGRAIMITGLQTGVVGFTVVVAEHDPGAELDQYEDVVEIDLEAHTPEICLVEWGDEAVHELPSLPAGVGNYRLRYHARRMDAAAKRGTNVEDNRIVDEYLLQIWPAPPTPPASIKITSELARHWQTDRR